MQFTPAIQPESIMQQFFRSMKLYFKALSHVVFFALLLSIVVFIPRISTLFTNQDLYQTTLFTWANLLILLVDLGALILFTSMLWRIKCRITDRHESFIEDFMTALKKTPQILVAVVIQVFVFVLINIAALGVFILTGQHNTLFTSNAMIYWMISGVFFVQSIALVYIYFLFFFYLALILTENQTALSALKKSVVLVWGNWWRTLIVQLLPWICYLIVLIIIRNVFKVDINLYFFQTPEVTYLIVLLQIILFALFIPWPAATMLTQLRDLELRKNI